MRGRPKGWTAAVEPDEGLRRTLLKFIADFANWDRAADRAWLDTGRALVKAAHGEEPPLVVDPFAGGGSIPLEALRLGCEAFASDLNPVACLILKVMLEDVPRHGPGLADALRKAGGGIKAAAERELAESLPEGFGRGDADCLPLGAHGALRGADLRGGDSADAFLLAVQEAEAPAGVARAGRAVQWTGWPAACRVRGLRAGERWAGAGGHGHAGQGGVPVLRCRIAAGAGAGAALRAARRRGRDLRWSRKAHRRRAPDRGGDAEAGGEGPSLPAAGRCRLRGGTQGAVAACRSSPRVGTRWEAGAVSGAGRAAAAGRHAGLSRAAVRDAAMGRSVHGAAEGGVDGSQQLL